MQFNFFVRMVSIALGVLSASAMAREGFKFELNEYFDLLVNVYTGGLEYVALMLLDPLIGAMFAKIRELFSVELYLQPHWKHVFVLLWLFFGSTAKVNTYRHLPIETAFYWAWGAICALIGGVFAGIFAINSFFVLVYPVASYVLYAAVVSAWKAFSMLWRDWREEGESFLRWFRFFQREILGRPFVLATAFAVALAQILPINEGRWLASLAFFIAGQAAVAMYFDVTSPKKVFYAVIGEDGAESRRPETFWEWMGDAKGVLVSLDILAVYGFTAFIVWLSGLVR